METILIPADVQVLEVNENYGFRIIKYRGNISGRAIILNWYLVPVVLSAISVVTCLASLYLSFKR